MYQLTSTTSILRTNDGAMIPADAMNADYQAYQVWLAAGNTPTAAATVAPNYAVQTGAALLKSDVVASRCYKAGVAFPSAWLTYVQTLRAIVDGSQQGPLPTQPNYPTGT
jgi:hypothetical protein